MKNYNQNQNLDPFLKSFLIGMIAGYLIALPIGILVILFALQ